MVSTGEKTDLLSIYDVATGTGRNRGEAAAATFFALLFWKKIGNHEMKDSG